MPPRLVPPMPDPIAPSRSSVTAIRRVLSSGSSCVLPPRGFARLAHGVAAAMLSRWEKAKIKRKLMPKEKPARSGLDRRINKLNIAQTRDLPQGPSGGFAEFTQMQGKTRDSPAEERSRVRKTPTRLAPFSTPRAADPPAFEGRGGKAAAKCGSTTPSRRPATPRIGAGSEWIARVPRARPEPGPG